VPDAATAIGGEGWSPDGLAMKAKRIVEFLDVAS
jgi:hypothetical protein